MNQIEITANIKKLLNTVHKSKWSEILKRAWDGCNDGEALAHEGYDFNYDPWDGNHEELRREIEEHCVAGIIKCKDY